MIRESGGMGEWGKIDHSDTGRSSSASRPISPLQRGGEELLYAH